MKVYTKPTLEIISLATAETIADNLEIPKTVYTKKYNTNAYDKLSAVTSVVNMSSDFVS